MKGEAGVVAEERIFGSPADGGVAKLAAGVLRNGNKR